MPTLVCNCPRCAASKGTFDVLASIEMNNRYLGASWQTNHEVYAICRHCHVGTIFILKLTDYDFVNRGWPKDFWTSNRALNDHFEVVTYISIKDFSTLKCPDHVPDNVKNAFDEGAACLAIAANNAASAMFRLSVDLATKLLLPAAEESEGPTSRVRSVLYHRVEWLAENGIIGRDLLELASCVREDGNDGVHDGNLSRAEAEDLADFSFALLTRIYTEPARIEEARLRRLARRST